ncbi:hypothetical protein D3C84_749950 [compost metagenome]
MRNCKSTSAIVCGLKSLVVGLLYFSTPFTLLAATGINCIRASSQKRWTSTRTKPTCREYSVNVPLSVFTCLGKVETICLSAGLSWTNSPPCRVSHASRRLPNALVCSHASRIVDPVLLILLAAAANTVVNCKFLPNNTSQLLACAFS